MTGKELLGIFEEAYNEWSNDKASRLAAALAYYAVFAIAPILIIAVAIAGLAFGEQAAQGQVMYQIEGLVGPEGAQTIQSMIENASKPASSIVATALGIIALLFGATGVFASLQDGLDTVWGVTQKPGVSWWRSFFHERLHAFAMLLGIGFLLLVSLLISAALAAATKYFAAWLKPAIIGEALNFVVSFAVTTVLFAMIYKILPDVAIAWRDVWVGAAVTALLFSLGKFAIGLYLGHSAIGSTYGAAGSLVVVLVWVYYSAQIFFMGAEITHVYANRYGSRIVPKANVIPISAEARGEQGLEPKRHAS